MDIETFTGPKLEITKNVFITEKSLGREFVEDLKNGHHLLDYGDSKWAIVHTGQVLPENHHQNTQSVYHGKILLNNSKILFGSLGPNQETSAHRHPLGMGELYYVFDGTLHVFRQDDGWRTLTGTPELPKKLWVPAESPHFGMTGDQPARIIIVMMNANHSPEEKHHIQLENPLAFKETAKASLKTLPFPFVKRRI